MKKYAGLIVTFAAIVLVVGGLVFLVHKQNTAPGQYDKLAQCLTDKGVKFYGAYWCPHCAEQKRILGTSMSHINFVECGVPANQHDQTQVCIDNKIESYPTWVFADGTRLTGEQQPSALGEKAGCSVQ
jgi:glutaredoxin